MDIKILILEIKIWGWDWVIVVFCFNWGNCLGGWGLLKRSFYIGSNVIICIGW